MPEHFRCAFGHSGNARHGLGCYAVLRARGNEKESWINWIAWGMTVVGGVGLFAESYWNARENMISGGKILYPCCHRNGL